MTSSYVGIGQASARSGLSVDTIRYYDSLGLIVYASRDGSGRRRFDNEALQWLVFLRQMRTTGMPLDQLRDYIDHRQQGAAGVAGVLEVLRAHQAAMRSAREQLDGCLEMVAAKIDKYEQLARSESAPGAPQV